jgi:hypothetical protein
VFRDGLGFRDACHPGSSADLYVRERRFVLHQDRKDIAVTFTGKWHGFFSAMWRDRLGVWDRPFS